MSEAGRQRIELIHGSDYLMPIRINAFTKIQNYSFFSFSFIIRARPLKYPADVFSFFLVFLVKQVDQKVLLKTCYTKASRDVTMTTLLPKTGICMLVKLQCKCLVGGLRRKKKHGAEHLHRSVSHHLVCPEISLPESTE